MLQELDRDQKDGSLYMSKRFTPAGKAGWVQLLTEGITDHDDDWLAEMIRSKSFMNTREPNTRSGGFKDVPYNAPEMLGEGEFSRFYVRGLCAYVLSIGEDTVIVYRGKSVENPRSQSQAMLGKEISAEELLNDLRTSQGVEPALGLPPGPNSGLTVKRISKP